ncbi:4-alpha-glucanotransferase [Archangium violaceum]|uniref:4-alpha-glucanotransferase n=1 Tax=Archangium violaceum TaxID=83451 RepID=UPI00195239D6|nr:4-alpha-glucanotransferase [Archangium violaceum]QRN96421.1 4-alpha-glucanotransferase [Archangium violaceum]
MPRGTLPEDYRRHVTAALAALNVRNLVLSIHDPSFPSTPGEDLGRGSPYSEGGLRFLEFTRELGFNGIQLGPQGQTSEDNPSPYDGTLFSRNVLNVALASLTHEESWGGLLRPERVQALVAARPGSEPRVKHRYAFRAQNEALDEAWEAFRHKRAQAAPGSAISWLAEHFDTFRREHHGWLERDALYDALCTEHGRPYWKEWSSEWDRRLWSPRPGEEAAFTTRRQVLLAKYAGQVEAYAFRQFLVHSQHAALRERTAAWGLKLFGDLQIGFSPRDAWAYQGLFVGSYLMGAPPSRTNPEGQPWNYPVLDPEQYHAPRGAAGPVLHFMGSRVNKMLSEYDGLRIDHPHGLVCPWVYRSGELNALQAVQNGARLFASPDLPDHPQLARWAIVPPEQLDRSVPRYADGWVRELNPMQVRRYSALFDAIIAAARAHGRQVSDLLCEVLSTMPHPLRRVMEQYGLGRFRVTQKADLTNPKDVYRSENAVPQDWIMVGNHDTKPIWALADRWRQAGEARAQAEYLAWRLHPEEEGREDFARRLVEEPGMLVQAKFADLFASRAENVMVFFPDLLGMKETYNAPGTVSEENWSLRVPNDYRSGYAEKLERDEALNLPKALALALRAGGEEARARHRGLIAALERLAAELQLG